MPSPGNKKSARPDTEHPASGSNKQDDEVDKKSYVSHYKYPSGG
jgi:hypothetical protein